MNEKNQIRTIEMKAKSLGWKHLLFAIISLLFVLHSPVHAHMPEATAKSSFTAVEVMVTPIVTVGLSLNTTFYNFGLVELSASTNSASAIVLTNSGDVNVSITKHAENSNNWTVSADPTPASNEFVLWSATGTARPGLSDYGTNVAAPADLVTSGLTNFTGILSGSSVSLIPGQSTNIWFRLRLPTSSATSASQRIPVHFVGEAQ